MKKKKYVIVNPEVHRLVKIRATELGTTMGKLVEYILLESLGDESVLKTPEKIMGQDS